MAYRLKKIASLAGVSLLAFGLLSCATDSDNSTVPGITPNELSKPFQTDFQPEILKDNEPRVHEGRTIEEMPRSSEIVASFPLETVPLENGLLIYDSGQRNESDWFAVVQVENSEQAEQIVEKIISEGGFAVTDSYQDDEGLKSWTLENPDATVDLLTMWQDKILLLNIDVEINP